MSDIRNKSDQRENRISRRHVLGTVAGTSVGLSGCLGWVPTGSDSSTVIDETSFSQSGLTVALAENSNAQSIGLIDPTGRSIISGELSAGQTKVTIPLVRDDPLTPGTYEVVAGRDGKSIAKQPVELTTGLKLTKVHTHESPMLNAPTDLVTTIKNTGTLPLKMENVRFEGVPNPTDGGLLRINRTAASTDEQQLIGIDQKASFRTRGRPLEYDESAKSPCGTTKQATVILSAKPIGTRRFNATIRYDGKEVLGPLQNIFCKNVTIENVSKQS